MAYAQCNKCDGGRFDSCCENSDFLFPSMPVSPTEKIYIILTFRQVDCWSETVGGNRRPVSSVGRVPDYRAGGRGFKPRPDHHSGSLND